MLFTSIGPVGDLLYVTGLAPFPVYLLDGRKPVLFEAGVACAGRLYGQGIQSVLGAREPEILFLTHAHWDHCGAASYLKNRFPHLTIAASRTSAEILKRRHARELIDRLNRTARLAVAALPGVDSSELVDGAFSPFGADRELKDGERIELERNVSVEVMATPGHTRDLISYYIPQKKILVASEASGVLDSIGNIIPQFLADYDAYLVSLKRLANLPAEILCQGHRTVFAGREEVHAFLERSVAETIHFKERVDELLERESGSIEQVVGTIKAEQYDINEGIKQPERAYLLNLRAQVTHLAEKRNRSR